MLGEVICLASELENGNSSEGIYPLNSCLRIHAKAKVVLKCTCGKAISGLAAGVW